MGSERGPVRRLRAVNAVNATARLGARAGLAAAGGRSARSTGHAAAALEDLDALVATWDARARERLLERYLELAERGVPLPAAFISSVSDLLDRDA